jgi:hypothetical protein
MFNPEMVDELAVRLAAELPLEEAKTNNSAHTTLVHGWRQAGASRLFSAADTAPDRDAKRDNPDPQYRPEQHAIDDPARLALRRELWLQEVDKSCSAALAHNAGVFVESAHSGILLRSEIRM